MNRETVFSSCRRYRYTLWREWGNTQPVADLFAPKQHSRDQYAQFICLNPSIADEVQDDPTVRRCIDYSKAWGFGAFCMTNLFGYRATQPAEMMRQQDPVGPDNLKHLTDVALQAGIIIAAWGALPFALNQARKVEYPMRFHGLKLHYLRLTADGRPSHPLYLPKELTPMIYEPALPSELESRSGRDVPKTIAPAPTQAR